MSRRSARIASLYGPSWSNLPSMIALRNASHDAKREVPVTYSEPFRAEPVHTIMVPTRGARTFTASELSQDKNVAGYFLSQYDPNASVLQRVRTITTFFEYLVKRPYFLLVNPGMKETAMLKIHEFKPQVAAHEARLAEYRMAATQIEMVICCGPLMNKGKDILANGMKPYEEEAVIWNGLKAVIDTLALILA